MNHLIQSNTGTFINIDGNKMHYIDKGEGEIILFAHGTPSWSFQFRYLIDDLSKRYRCIAADMLGFGLSDKPIDINYTPKAHSERLSQFISLLNIKPKYIYGHDFGLSILIGAMNLSNSLMDCKKLFISNSWLWDLRPFPHFAKAHKTLPMAIAKFLYLNMNFSAKVILKAARFKENKLIKEEHLAYLFPFKKKDDRISTFTFFQELLYSGDWYNEQLEVLRKQNHLEKILVWGMEDKFVPSEVLLPIWKQHFPNLLIEEINQAGHFPDEEKPEEFLKLMKKYL